MGCEIKLDSMYQVPDSESLALEGPLPVLGHCASLRLRVRARPPLHFLAAPTERRRCHHPPTELAVSLTLTQKTGDQDGYIVPLVRPLTVSSRLETDRKYPRAPLRPDGHTGQRPHLQEGPVGDASEPSPVFPSPAAGDPDARVLCPGVMWGVGRRDSTLKEKCLGARSRSGGRKRGVGLPARRSLSLRRMPARGCSFLRPDTA